MNKLLRGRAMNKGLNIIHIRWPVAGCLGRREGRSAVNTIKEVDLARIPEGPQT